jgi:hypothetical protein
MLAGRDLDWMKAGHIDRRGKRVAEKARSLAVATGFFCALGLPVWSLLLVLVLAGW